MSTSPKKCENHILTTYEDYLNNKTIKHTTNMPCQQHQFTFNIYMKPIKTDKVQAKSPTVVTT